MLGVSQRSVLMASSVWKKIIIFIKFYKKCLIEGSILQLVLPWSTSVVVVRIKVFLVLARTEVHLKVDVFVDVGVVTAHDYNCCWSSVAPINPHTLLTHSDRQHTSLSLLSPRDSCFCVFSPGWHFTTDTAACSSHQPSFLSLGMFQYLRINFTLIERNTFSELNYDVRNSRIILSSEVDIVWFFVHTSM